MADVVEGAEHAPGKAAGLLTKRVGPLPAWAWVGGLVGGFLAFRVLTSVNFGGGAQTASNAPRNSSQSSGPASLGNGPESTYEPGSSTGTGSSSDSILAQLVQAVGALSSQVQAGFTATPSGGGAAPRTQTATAPERTIQNVWTDPSGKAALDIITFGPPIATMAPAGGLASTPTGDPGVQLTNEIGQSTGALPGLQESGNAPGVSFQDGNLVYTPPS